jgi:hypothetical protein
MPEETPHRSYFFTVLACRCPRCRIGKLFKYPPTWRFNRNTEMNKYCPVCGQATDIEVGFYYGTGYVSYFIALLLTGVSFLLWFLIIGFSFSDSRFLYWVILNSIALLASQPWLMRFARSLWLSMFVKYDPDWKDHKPDDPERINTEQMNNW